MILSFLGRKSGQNWLRACWGECEGTYRPLRRFEVNVGTTVWVRRREESPNS